MKEEIALVGVIMLITFAFTGGIMHMTCSPEPDVTPIKSASMSGQTQGSFGLFGGTINEVQYYFYYTEQGEGMMLEKSDAERTIIVEGTDNPRAVKHPCQDNKLYVPDDTVILDYSVAQPGVKQ